MKYYEDRDARDEKRLIEYMDRDARQVQEAIRKESHEARKDIVRAHKIRLRSIKAHQKEKKRDRARIDQQRLDMIMRTVTSHKQQAANTTQRRRREKLKQAQQVPLADHFSSVIESPPLVQHKKGTDNTTETNSVTTGNTTCTNGTSSNTGTNNSNGTNVIIDSANIRKKKANDTGTMETKVDDIGIGVETSLPNCPTETSSSTDTVKGAIKPTSPNKVEAARADAAVPAQPLFELKSVRIYIYIYIYIFNLM